MIAKLVLAADDLSSLYQPAGAMGGNAAQISTLLNPIIANVLLLSGLAAFFVIIFAGFTYITGSGDKNKVAQAQNMLNNGILGIGVVVAAFLITRIVGTLFGFKFF